MYKKFKNKNLKNIVKYSCMMFMILYKIILEEDNEL